MDRVACPRRIRTFIDPEAVFLFIAAEQILDVSGRKDGKSFDAPGGGLHRDGKCRFEVLGEDLSIQELVVGMLAQIVQGADILQDISCMPESAGFSAIAEGRVPSCADDHRNAELAFPIHGALYAWCQKRLSRALSMRNV